MNSLKTVLFVIFFLLTSAFFRDAAGQGATNTINATVKISVCGNDVIEGGEDCEGANLNGRTCESLGYSSGNLTCDISCSFDTSACISPTPTPTPIPTTPAPTQTTSGSTTQSTALEERPTTTPAEITSQTDLLADLLTEPIRSLTLPARILQFDLNGNGIIDLSDFEESLSLWVAAWRNYLKYFNENENIQPSLAGEINCDIDDDGYCDLVDLSILLYYININQ